MNLFRGKLTGHAKGFAFVTPEDNPGMDDIFIPPNETGTAMHGDIVMVRVSRKHRAQGKKARSSEYLERGMTQVVGTYYRKQKFWFCHS